MAIWEKMGSVSIRCFQSAIKQMDPPSIFHVRNEKTYTFLECFYQSHYHVYSDEVPVMINEYL